MPQPTSHPRLSHLDNLRTALTALVILHHTALPHGGLGSWPYASPHHALGSSRTLSAFNALNQSFFMGSFFYVSGIMSARSLKRKSVRSFLKAKWVKLGGPVVVYSLFGPPVNTAIMAFFRGESVGFWRGLGGHVMGLRSVQGPVWYPALLLLFDTTFSLSPLPPPHLTFYPTLLLDITSSFLLQTYLPRPLGPVFKFFGVRPGYFPQYLIAYMLGTRSTPNTSLTITPTTRNILLATSIFSGASMLWLLHSHPDLSFSSPSTNFTLAYTIWNESTGYLLGSSLLRLFAGKEWGSRSWGAVGRYSYTAFLVHAVVCVGCQVAAEGWRGGGVVKSCVLGTGAVVGSWGVGWVVGRVPGVRGILM